MSIKNLLNKISISAKTNLAIVATGLLVIVATTFVFHCTQYYYKNYSYGAMCFNKGKYKEALPHLVRAVEADPNSIEAVQYLALVYDRLGENANALKTLQHLMEMTPENLATKKWLAGAYFRLDDYANAEIYYRQLLLVKEDSFIQRKLADTLIGQRNYSQAIPILIYLVQQNPREYELIELLADVYSWEGKYGEAINLYRDLISSTAGPNKARIIVKLADIMRYTGRNEEAIKLYSQSLKED